MLGSVFSVSSDSPSEKCQAPSIAFDGTNFLVVWHFTQSSSFEIDGARVSPAGVVVDAMPAVLVHDSGGASSYFSTPPALVFAGDGYMLGWSEASKILASRVTPALARLDTPAIQIATGSDSFDPALAWDGTRYFVTFSNYDSNTATSAPFSRQLSATGTPLGQAVPLAASASGSYANAAVGADSNGALALYCSGKNDSEDLQGALLDSTTGAVTATKALVATTGAQWDPSLAAGGASFPFLLSWVDTRNAGGSIYASRLGADRAPLDGTGLLVSYALNKETAPALAGSKSGFVVAWIDSREGGYQVYGTSLDSSGAPSRTNAVAYASGRPRRSNVAVASDGTKSLVVWNENDFSSNVPLVGRIVGPDGTPQTAAVALEPTKLMYEPVVAYGGGVYLAVGMETTGSGWNTRGLRVSPAGQAIDATPFIITTAAFRPAMASDGSNFLLVWGSGNSVMGARVGSDGTVLDTNPFTISPVGSTVLGYPEVAFGGGSYLVVWESVSSPDIVGVRVTPAGKVTDTNPLPIVTETVGSTVEVAGEPGIAFDGTNFQVAWRSTLFTMSLSLLSYDYKVTQVSPDGSVGTTVRAGPSGAGQASSAPVTIAANSSGHAVVAYTKLDSPAGYAIDRVRLAALSEQKNAAGAACQTAADCTSGFCADGVCCDASCTGDVFDCRACSILAGAATNGMCGAVVDGHACGSRGTCSAGTCIEDRDAGANTGGGGIGTASGGGAAGATVTSGGAGGVTSRADASAGSGNNPGGSGAAGGLSAGGGSQGGLAGNAGGAGNGGALAGGLAGNAGVSVHDAGATGGSQATSGSSSQDSGCGCRVAAPRRSSSLAFVAMFLVSIVRLLRRSERTKKRARSVVRSFCRHDARRFRGWLRAAIVAMAALVVACSSSSGRTSASGPGSHREAGVGGSTLDSGAHERGEAATDTTPPRSDPGTGGKPTMVGVPPRKPPPSPSIDASVPDGGRGSVDAGASCDDPNCGCDGFHRCASGCCAFAITTLVPANARISFDQFDIAVSPDGTIHAIIEHSYLTYATVRDGKTTIEDLGDGAWGYAVAIALDGTSPVVSFFSGPPTIQPYVTRRQPSGWSRAEPVSGQGPDAIEQNMLAFDPSGALQQILYGNYDLQCFVDTPTDAATSVECSAYDSTQSNEFTGYGFDTAGNPFVSIWASAPPAQVTVRRHVGGSWTTTTFGATTLSDGTPGLGTLDANGNPSFFYKGEYHAFSSAGEKVEDTTLKTPRAIDLRAAANGNIAYLGVDGIGADTRIAVALRTPSGWASGWLGNVPNLGNYRLTMAPDGLPVACWTVGQSLSGMQSLRCAKW